MDWSDQLKKIYYDPNDPGSLGGVERLLARGKETHPNLTIDQVKKFLSEQNAYTLHKPYRLHYKRNKTIVGSIDKQWQIDLCDMTDLARTNGGYRYILTCIDCFSRYAWAVPVQKKSGKETEAAFRKLFKQSYPRVPERIQTDKGKEFFNKDVRGLLKAKNILLFASESDFKAALVERFNRTLKTRLWRFFTANATDQYLKVLPKIMHSYNHSVHRSIGQTPASVQKKDELKIWMRQFASHSRKRPRKKPLVGDTVRLRPSKDLFVKGYVSNWTDETFNVDNLIDTQKPVYKLKDAAGEEMLGTYYAEEVQKITPNENAVFLIEKVLRKRKINGIEEAFIKWKGLPKKFNSWIPAADIIKHGTEK